MSLLLSEKNKRKTRKQKDRRDSVKDLSESLSTKRNKVIKIVRETYTVESDHFSALPENLKKLVNLEETKTLLGYPIHRLTLGSPQIISHKCPICNQNKLTPYKLFVQGKNSTHVECCSVKRQRTNLQLYNVTNAVNRPELLNARLKEKDDEIIDDFKNEGYKVLNIYRDIRKEIIIEFECPEMHKHHITWKAWSVFDQRCFYCCKTYLDLNTIVNSFREANYTLLTDVFTEYQNQRSPLRYICNSKHKHENTTTWAVWNGNGCRCPQCTGPSSKGEEEVRKTFADYYPIKTKKIITPYEIDAYFQKQKLAIEYCGLYWHCVIPDSPRHERMTPESHAQKLKMCNDLGIRLITIFEDEWYDRKEVCISRIKAALGILETKIYARETIVKQIEKKEAHQFTDKHHLQGMTGCEYAIGLYCQDSLVGVMTFGACSRAHASNSGTILELKRFCSKTDTLVVGGANKMFRMGAQIAKEMGYKQIKSYCDKRWGTGGVYKQLGMKKINESLFDVHYTNGATRYREQTINHNPELIEIKNLHRIYDCGCQTWIYDL
jgi:hypothetical protein